MKYAVYTFLVTLSLGLFMVACGGGAAADAHTQSAGGEPPIAEQWRARCGNCHTRVEPGTHTRAQLEDAFTRHRTRTKLSEPQWSEMVDFLSAK